MKICLVTAFPPSGRQLNEYGLHLARELRRNPFVNLTILGDRLTDYDWATDEHGNPLPTDQRKELEGFRVVRCWESNSPGAPLHIARVVHRIQPDVVWFNLVYSTFATHAHPVVAFAGLCTPALTRSLGFFTHVTLHQIVERVDLASAGVKQERVFRIGSYLATKALLMANSVTVLLPGYRQTLVGKYQARNVLLGTHGTFTSCPTPPDFSLRGNPDHRLLAIGHWGTYKRLETLMEAIPAVLRRVPSARLIIAGSNHHTRPGYWESIREKYGPNPRIEFRGYIPEDAIPELFRTSSIVILPYDSATGSSGPAHLACEYGVPIVSADISDFRDMAANEDMSISFYKIGDPVDLAAQIIGLLESPQDQRRAAEQNYSAAIRMTMPHVVRHYMRWFELERRKQTLNPPVRNLFSRLRRRRASLRAALHTFPPSNFRDGLLQPMLGPDTPSKVSDSPPATLRSEES
ncbi:MAG TPA: glycosyltransferase [Terriglobales bacterium]|nr:glycosyltransferase [Terriglobales bacterium]